MKIRNRITGAEYSSPTLEGSMSLGHYIDKEPIGYGKHFSDKTFFCSNGWEEVRKEIVDGMKSSKTN